MGENEEPEKGKNEKSRGMPDMMKEFFTEDMKKEFKDMKDEVSKGFKRSFAALFAVAFAWVVFISLHSFLWSTSYTFYQNLVITFDSILLAIIIGIALVYKVSGIGKMTKKFSTLAEKFGKKDETQ